MGRRVAQQAIMVALVWAAASSARADTFRITSMSDGWDAVPGDGRCATAKEQCTLRAAIQEANFRGGVNHIEFALSGSAPHRIKLASALPPIVHPIVIDATTQPGYDAAPVVELDGGALGEHEHRSGLELRGGDSAVAGLAIVGFDGSDGSAGLLLRSDGNRVERSYFGVTADGTRRPNAIGIRIIQGDRNRIGGSDPGQGNLVSGNRLWGIRVEETRETVIQGNYVGTDRSGTDALSNGGGVAIDGGAQILVGGSERGSANVVSGNGGVGLHVARGVRFIRIERNYVGTDASGAAPVPNGGSGVVVGSALGAELVNNVVSANAGSGAVFGPGIEDAFVDGNRIGSDASGHEPMGNRLDGVVLRGGSQLEVGGPLGNLVLFNGRNGVLVESSSDSRIDGNVLSGNSRHGLVVRSSRHVVVRDNHVGVDAPGTGVLGNDAAGIFVDDSVNIVVGEPGAGNVVADNDYGILIYGEEARDNAVRGNLIGLDRNSEAPFGNRQDGVRIGLGAVATVIGGAGDAGNVIVASGGDGIEIFDGASGTGVYGNLIGVEAGGEAWGNGTGIRVRSGPARLGSAEPESGNVISGNRGTAVMMDGHAASGVRIEHNRIGLGPDSDAPLGNEGFGVRFSGASDNVVRGNVIAHNEHSGVWVEEGDRDRITDNRIYGNGALGIALGQPDTVARNDEWDEDGGPNRMQNFPILQSAVVGTSLRIEGSLSSTPQEKMLIQFFASSACHESGYGEGERLVGSAEVTTDGSGLEAFSLPFPGAVTRGELVTATATDVYGNTSEFSPCILVEGVESGEFASRFEPSPSSRLDPRPSTLACTAGGAGLPGAGGGVVLVALLGLALRVRRLR